METFSFPLAFDGSARTANRGRANRLDNADRPTTAMRRTVHIIASCTERKRITVPSELRLREISMSGAFERAESWWRRLSTHRTDTVAAIDLYGGDHWSVAKSLPATARANGLDAYLWIASAGYGLVPVEAQLRPYSATFATGHRDSVFVEGAETTACSEFTRRWWAHLGEMPGPLRGAPRTLARLVKRFPDACVLVTGSPDYISAMQDDLMSAISETPTPDRIVIVSRPGPFAKSVLRNHVVPSDARLQRSVGGARTSLHVRVAKKILEEISRWEFSARILRTHYGRVLASSAAAPTFDRERLTDEQVERFIRTEFYRTPGLSYTRALRALRDRGMACEQSRFKDIFHRTLKIRHAL